MNDNAQTPAESGSDSKGVLGPVLRSVLDVIDDGVIVFSGSECICINPAGKRLLRLKGEPRDFEELLQLSGLVTQDLMRTQFARALTAEDQNPALHSVKGKVGVECVEIQFIRESDRLVAVVHPRSEWESLERFKLLAEIGRLGAEGHADIEVLVDNLLGTLFERLNVDIAVLALFDGDRLQPVGWRGFLLDPAHVADPLMSSYVRVAIEQQIPVEGDGGEWEGGEMTGCHVVLPLSYSGKVLGTLHLGSLQATRLFDLPNVSSADDSDPFDESGLAYLNTLGSYIASALGSAETFAQREAETSRLEALVRQFHEGVILYNARGEILFYNDAMRDIIEFTPRNLNTDSRPYRIRNKAGQLMPRAEWPFFRVVHSEGGSLDLQIVLDFGGRQKTVDARGVCLPTIEGQVPVFLGTLDDITSRAEQDRRKDEFLSIASHELRSPLTPLTGFLQMTRKQVREGEPVSEDLVRRSQEQVSRLSRLIDVLLDMTRIETGRMVLFFEEVDLRAVVNRVVCSWSDHPSGVAIQPVLPSEAMMATVDAARIDQVLSNLIDNSIKHSTESEPIIVSLEASGNTALIKVVDFGEGIDASALGSVFDQFFQSGPNIAGSKSMGLGLFITRQMVVQHGGSIEIESIVGEGTQVSVTLPLRQH